MKGRNPTERVLYSLAATVRKKHAIKARVHSGEGKREDIEKIDLCELHEYTIINFLDALEDLKRFQK